MKSRHDTLRVALEELGFSLGRPMQNGRYQLSKDAQDVGKVIDVASGWKLVHLLRNGEFYGSTREAIDYAIELAAQDLLMKN